MNDDLDLSPAPIEAEIVPVAEVRRKRGKNINTKAVQDRDHNFTDVALFKTDQKDYVYGKFSGREKKLIAVILKTGNVKKAAEEIGVSPQTVYNYLKRPFVKAYLEQQRMRMASAADLTMDKVARVIGQAVDGVEISAQQLAAAGMAAKILRPAGGSGNITVNQQYNYNGASPFADLEQSAMLDEIKKNLLEMREDEDAEG